jgi:hypothetical protein
MAGSEDASFLGRGRIVDALAAGLVFGVGAVVVAYAFSQMCFHNTAGVAVAAADSERGPICDAVAGRSEWEAKLVGAGLVFGAGVALLPFPIAVRAALYAVAATAMVVISLYAGTLDYFVSI